jgi:hypothetical protein
MSTTRQNAKGSATARTVPSHDPINSDPGDDMNEKIHSTAYAEKEPTPPEHEHTEAVVIAAMWLADENPAQPIPTIRRMFGLTALQACEAAALANKYRIVRRAHG